MIRALPCLCVAFALVARLVAAEPGSVQRVPAFQGQYSESFENVTSTDLKDLMGGIASFSGNNGTSLTVQNGDYQSLWDQHAFDGSYFLGGNAGYGTLATVEIRFSQPVNRFGGIFGHRVRPGVNSDGETEFVFYDTQNNELGRDRVFIGSYPGGVAAHWEFSAKVKRITFSYIHPMADGLTADVAPEDPPSEPPPATNAPPSVTNTPPQQPPDDPKPPKNDPPPQEIPPADPASTFTLSGTVTDGAIGVVGVRVKLGKQYAVTDENGNFQFTGLASGKYKLHATAPRMKVRPAQVKVQLDGDQSGVDFVVVPKRSR
jgi:hypothetical protein